MGTPGWVWGAWGWRVCSALLPKAGLWTGDFPHLPHCKIPREGENPMAEAGLGFRIFESCPGLFSPFMAELRKQPKFPPLSGGVQWAELSQEGTGGGLEVPWIPTTLKITAKPLCHDPLRPSAVSFPLPPLTPLKAELLHLLCLQGFQGSPQ